MAIRAASLIVDVDADVKAAQSKIQSVDKDLKNLAKSDHELKVDADTAQAERSVQELDKMIVRIAGQNVEVSVDADLNPALAELARAEQQAKELDNLNPSIEVDADTQEAEAGLRRLSTEMRDLDGLQGKVAQSAGGFAAGLGGIAKTALGVAGGIGLATAGSRLLGDAFGFVTDSMFGTNIAMENVEARLMAFTKDGAETQRILAEIRTEAAETPFAFNEMADAVASLLPPAKQANLDLMDLVETAEILAASNPLEGLEGAAFALREALSGDFQSLIERFNIPRTEINRLKEEGLPNIEIVRQAMQSLGLDITLVGNLAQTTSGKWSTFQDNIRNALAAIGEPFMDKINSGLTDLVAFTETEQFTAMMERWADKAVTVADKVGDIGAAMADMPNQDWFKAFQSMASGNDVDAGAWGEFAGFMNDVADAFNWVGTSGARAHNAIAGIGDDASGAAGGAWELSDAQKAVQEATEGVEDAVTRSGGAKQRDHQATMALADANAYLGNTYRDAAGWVASYYAGVGYGNDVLLYQTDIALQLNNALGMLSTTQGSLNDVMGVFSAQGTEYQSTQQSLTEAYEILQRRQSEGIQLSESEQLLLDRYPDLYGRLQGAQEDAAVQEGEVAAAKTEVMLAQDQLNEAIARGEKDLGPYNERLDTARSLLSDVDPESGAQVAIQNLTDAINQNLVTSINDLITKLGELDGTTANPKVTLDTTAFDLGVGQSEQGLTEFDQAQAEPTADLDNDPFNSKIEDARVQLRDFDGRHATATIEAHFISTGDPLAMQAYGYHSGGTVVGITQAEGGFHDKPTVALIGEDGPELVLPLSKPARMHQLLSQAGIVPMAEGGIVGGSTSGGVNVTAFGSPDWGWLFEGLDVKADDYTKRAADAFDGLFRDIRKLATGEAARDAQKELDRLLTVKQIAIETGAGADVIAGLDAQIAAQQAQVQAIGAAMGTDIVAGIQSEILNANFAEDVATAWDASLRNFDSILSGDRITALEQTIEKLGEQLNIAKVVGAPEEVVAAIAENLAAAQRELATSQQIYDQALEAGLVDIEAPFRIPLEELTALMPQMKDGGIGLIDELIEGIADGSTNLAGVMGTVDKIIEAGTDKSKETIGATGAEMMETLQKLEEQLTVELAQALISGSEETVAAIEAQIKVIDDLMSHVELTADTTVKSLQRINEVSGQIIKPPSGMGSSSSSGGFNATDVRNGTVRIGNAINLTMANGDQVAQWYADQQYRDEQLAPVGIGG